jgi:hypothetical protein
MIRRTALTAAAAATNLAGPDPTAGAASAMAGVVQHNLPETRTRVGSGSTIAALQFAFAHAATADSTQPVGTITVAAARLKGMWNGLRMSANDPAALGWG